LELCLIDGLGTHNSVRFMIVEDLIEYMQTTGGAQNSVEKALEKWKSKTDKLGIFIIFGCILLGAYSSFPGLQNGLSSASIVPLLFLVGSALMVSEVIENGPEQRTRIATISGLIGPLVAIAGIHSITIHHGDNFHQLLGGIGWIAAGTILFSCNAFIFQNENNIGVIRYRAMTRLMGMAIATAWIISNSTEPLLIYFLIPILIASFIFSLDLRLGKKERKQKKEFSNRYDSLQLRILEIRAAGSVIDQSVSLLKRANEIGWTDFSEGMKLLDSAEDDIERTLSLSKDIVDIEVDSERKVIDSEGIAPMTEGPRNAMNQGKRELELGSLREAEKLFRIAKIRALDIIEHWENAEIAIQNAREAITGLMGSDLERMQSLMMAAEDAMDNENPGEALIIAEAIPGHVENLGEAMDAAISKVDDAKEMLSRTDGLVTTIWDEMLSKAMQAMEDGNGSMARGLADSIIREITATEEAKSSMQRALRQRKSLRKRWEGHIQEDQWENRLQEILDDTKNEKWRVALQKMETLTSDLDALNAAQGDAEELLNFIENEWKDTRNRLESSGIGPQDKDRLACESEVSKARIALNSGDVDSCLKSLGKSDELMERLRRRF